MAKKIVLSFLDQPLVGVGFSYEITINGIQITYANGVRPVSTSYRAFGGNNEPPMFIELKPTLSESIDNTLNFLIANYVYSNVIYRRVNDTIEITIDTDDVINVYYGELNTNISAETLNVSATDDINLRYFFQYTNIVNDTFLCQIFKKNNLLPAIEVSGSATYDKGSIKDHLDTIRGTGLTLELEATSLVALEDLYSENEQDFTVRLYKNNKLIFYGYLKPDGVFQSFTRDVWTISLDCVDGLGALNNLSFVQSNGTNFIGKMKAIDIIYYCLKRSGISLSINTCINTLYDGLTPTDNLDILTKIKLNADRFVKVDNDTIMSCEEVLKSVLDIFCAVITQRDAEWYIYKPNELYDNGYALFRRYDVNNVYAGNKTINFNQVLGSQIDNFYPHHCSGNQKIEIKGGISAFRLGYKYGFVSGLLPNPSLIHDGSLNYEGWVVEDGFNLINDPTKLDGFIIRNSTFGNTTNIVKSIPIVVTTADSLKLKIVFTSRNGSGDIAGRFIRMRIQQGIYYLKYNPANSSTPIDDVANAIWTTNSSDTYTFWLNGQSTYELSLPNFLADGNLTLAIMTIYPNLGVTEIDNIDLIPNVGDKPEIGEFHTVSRATKISSIVKENRTVYNGDNAGIVYLGAIFKEDGVTPTNTWFRKGKFESFPLLRIAAEEELRIGQKPLKVFRGSVFGEIPYMSLIDINNIQGKFLPIEYSYDTKANITNLKLLELFCPEISDIIYKFTFDYGNTVKPTIKS